MGFIAANKYPICHIFLKISGKILLNVGDAGNHDHHQDKEDYQKCHPSKCMAWHQPAVMFYYLSLLKR